jgi:hypothetical protein
MNNAEQIAELASFAHFQATVKKLIENSHMAGQLDAQGKSNAEPRKLAHEAVEELGRIYGALVCR